jgi:hypothetical protein
LRDVDVPVWKSKSGVYSCAENWNLLGVHSPEVSWWHVVWFPQATPRHAFLLWLVYREKLSQPRKDVWLGFYWKIHCVDSVIVAKNQLNTSFPNAVSAIGSGGI